MPEKIRFLFDEHIPTAVAAGLKRRGIDVLTMQEAKRLGRSDLDQLQFAAANHRVIVTHDHDFLRIAAEGEHHAGVVWCPATKYSIGDLIRCLVLIHAVLNLDEMRDYVEYL